MTPLVIDTAVAVKAVLPEEDSAAADALLDAAAESLGVHFVTADQALHKNVSKHLPWVTLLSQLPSPES